MCSQGFTSTPPQGSNTPPVFTGHHPWISSNNTLPEGWCNYPRYSCFSLLLFNFIMFSYNFSCILISLDSFTYDSINYLCAIMTNAVKKVSPATGFRRSCISFSLSFSFSIYLYIGLYLILYIALTIPLIICV